MTTYPAKRVVVPAIAISFLMLAVLACGTSTAEQLASAVPTTADAVRATESSGPEPTEAGLATAASPTGTSPGPATQVEPLRLVAQGFGQSQREIGFGFVIENPNPGHAIENSQYQIAAYDASGAVVETDSGFIDVVLPSQALGIGGTMILNEGVTVAKMEVQLSTGDAQATDLSATFTVDKITYTADALFPKARGDITNPYDRDITLLRVSAILYNDAGEIIGGGFSFLNFLLAKSAAGVEITTASAGNVARVEIYPTLSGLSTLALRDELPADAQILAVVKQGFGQSETEVGYGLLILNPNGGYAVENSMYQVTLYAEDGTVVGTTEGFVEVLLPNQTLGIGGDIFVDEGALVARAVMEAKAGDFTASDALPTFTSENVSYQPDTFFPKVTGQIVSPYSKVVTNVRVSAIAYDATGDIVGGGFTFVDFVPANGKAAADVSITSAETPATVELYATISALSEIK